MHIAHISGDGRMQTCTEHSRNTAELAKKALESNGLGNTAYLTGLLHDCGKFTGEFNDYIQHAVKGEARRGSVIHSFAGGVFLLDHYHKDLKEIDYNALAAEWMACAIFNHHGLIDLINDSGENGYERRKAKQPDYERRAQEAFLQECAGKEELNDLFGKAVVELRDKMQHFPQAKDNDENLFYAGLLTRLLTSAVVEGDRTDTADFMAGESRGEAFADKELIWSECIRSLNRKLASFPINGRLQEARRSFSESCAAFADHPAGIYRLDLPTGSGKTLCSLRFALEHAKKAGKKRILYVAPLLSILEQNVEVIRDAVGNDDWILEHHSNVTAEKKEEDDRELKPAELLQENWDAPIIVTTLVRVLETMFSHQMADVRRFQALCDSVIIFDEVQSVPNRMLSMFNLTLNFLAACCNTTVVLCSATQPPFDKACREMNIAPERIVNSCVLDRYAALFKRTDIQYDGSYTSEEMPEYIAGLYQKSRNLLVVCNTKIEAANLYERLRNRIPLLFHLSAGMCMEHRKRTLTELRKALAKEKQLVCISTQVIEAGIDISFESVVRLSAGLDSVVQCAGRCNRNGESESPRPVRIILHADQKLGPLKDIGDAQDALNALVAQFRITPERFSNDLASEEAVNYYYECLYRAMKKGSQDYPTKQDTLFSMLGMNETFLNLCKTPGLYAMNQAFKTAAHLFSVFDNDTQSILIPYDKGADVIRELESETAKYNIGYCKSLIREAKGYDVTVSVMQLKSLLEIGAVRSICNNMFYAAESYCYDINTGLLTAKKAKERLERCDTLIL